MDIWLNINTRDRDRDQEKSLTLVVTPFKAPCHNHQHNVVYCCHLKLLTCSQRSLINSCQSFKNCLAGIAIKIELMVIASVTSEILRHSRQFVSTMQILHQMCQERAVL